MNEWAKSFLATNSWAILCALIGGLMFIGMRYSEYTTKVNFNTDTLNNRHVHIAKLNDLDNKVSLLETMHKEGQKYWDYFDKTIQNNTEVLNQVNATLTGMNMKLDGLEKRVENLESK